LKLFNLTYKTNTTLGSKKTCWYCGHEERCTKDHFFPQSLGGRLKVYACCLCQGAKGRKTPLEWMEYVKHHPAIERKIADRILIATRGLWEKIKKGIDEKEVELLKQKSESGRVVPMPLNNTNGISHTIRL
jgi:hypothetical protein